MIPEGVFSFAYGIGQLPNHRPPEHEVAEPESGKLRRHLQRPAVAR